MAADGRRTYYPNGVDVSDGTNGGLYMNGTQIIDADGNLLTSPDITVASVTTGIGLAMDDNTALTTGQLQKIASSATAITTTGRLFLSDHTGATGTSATLNEFKTAANDETILLALTAESLTTGKILSFGACAALTTGQVINIAHTTSVIADGGCLIKVSSSGIDTGGATVGTLLDLKSTAQLAGTLVRVDTILTTGTAMSIIGTGAMTTTGNLLTLTANSATTAAGILRINANALTDGIGAVIASSATAMTATGRLLSVSHTGATTASGAGILAEVASAATDATTIVKITASAALAAGKVLQLSPAALTTGSVLYIGNADALTTGRVIDITSNSADATARSLVYVKNDHASATAATCLELVNDAPLGAIKTTVAATSTNYFKVGVFNGVTLWVGNGTGGNGALSGTAGDILFNGASNKPEYCTGTTNWTALV